MKKILLVLLLLIVMVLPGCSEVEDVGNELIDQAANIAQAQEEHVLAVKNATPNLYPGCTYGDAFDHYFGSPTWKYFEAEDGSDVVEFTGYCQLDGKEVKARLQFILDMTAGMFETGALSFNDIAQSNIVTLSLIEDIFEEYGTSVNTYESYESYDWEAGSPEWESVAAALNFEAWLQPFGEELCWYSWDTYYNLIPFIDDLGYPCIAFASENNLNAYAIGYYANCTYAEVTGNGGLIFKGDLVYASDDAEYIGEVEIVWGSEDMTNSISVSMPNADIFAGGGIVEGNYIFNGVIQ